MNDSVEILQKSLNNLKLKLEHEIKSAIAGKNDLNFEKLFNDFEKYFKYKKRIESRIFTNKK